MNNLTCTCVPRLVGVSAADLGRLFPAPSSTASLLSLLQETGIEGFTFRSIVVSKDDVPLLLLPLFETRFDLSSFVEGWIKKTLKIAGLLIPTVFHPRVLGVGLVEGEWSEIGIDPDIDEGTLDAACTLAMSALQTLAAELKSDLVVFYNFNQVQYRSYARLPINFTSVEEYLSGLSTAARKDLRRKMRVAPEVRVIRSRDITPYLDQIYKLYLETVERSPMALGAHNRSFFEKICEIIPGAEYIFYYVHEELVAFNLIVVNQQTLVDIYFCMDFDLGRKYKLYFLSWFENVRTCVELKIPFYCAGQGTEKTKAHLGATFVPSYILFKHRLPLIDRLLVGQPGVPGEILSHLGFWPKKEIHAQRN